MPVTHQSCNHKTFTVEWAAHTNPEEVLAGRATLPPCPVCEMEKQMDGLRMHIEDLNRRLGL